MLEKLNAIAYDPARNVVIKRLTDPVTAAAERGALQALHRMPEALKRHFRVPAVSTEAGSVRDVVMERVDGIRVYDFIALLNRIMREDGDDTTSARARTMKESLVGRALDVLRAFQGAATQSALRAQIGSALSAYDFRGKLTEALSYIRDRVGLVIDPAMAKETETICDHLAARAGVVFRDASLKNTIMVVPAWLGRSAPSPASGLVADFHRYSDRQWVDPAPIREILDRGELLDQLDATFYQIDFESCHGVTVVQDDWFHILMSEIVAESFDASQRYVQRMIAADRRTSNKILLLRGFREWARRLFYLVERPETYVTRYAHETLSYNFYLAYDAVGRLSAEDPASGGLDAWKRFMDQAERAMAVTYPSSGIWRSRV